MSIANEEPAEICRHYTKTVIGRDSLRTLGTEISRVVPHQVMIKILTSVMQGDNKKAFSFQRSIIRYFY